MRTWPARYSRLFCTVAIVFMTEVLSTVASACPSATTSPFATRYSVISTPCGTVIFTPSPPESVPAPATVESMLPRCTATDFAVPVFSSF